MEEVIDNIKSLPLLFAIFQKEKEKKKKEEKKQKEKAGEKRKTII